MKSQTARDEQAVTIATTLAIFIGVIALGAAAFWLLDRGSDPSTPPERAFVAITLGAALVVSCRYLLRHRRS